MALMRDIGRQRPARAGAGEVNIRNCSCRHRAMRTLLSTIDRYRDVG